jgi:hypothetical protein
MKNTMRIFIHVLAVSLLVGFASCDPVPPTPEPTEAEKRTTILTTGGTWNLQSVTVNNVDQTEVYEGLTLSFSSSGYTATNGGTIWPTSGSWDFTNDAGTTISRSDDLEISVTEITQSKLVLGLSWSTTTLGPGRTNSLAGAHVFTFTR